LTEFSHLCAAGARRALPEICGTRPTQCGDARDDFREATIEIAGQWEQFALEAEADAAEAQKYS
jgi:hypothetical protein